VSLTEQIIAIGCTVIEKVPYSSMGYWRIGGPIRYLVTVHTVEQLKAVFALAEQFGQVVLVLGNGSNMLMSDEGLDGIGIVLEGDFGSTTFDSDGVILGAGVKNVRALSMCKRHGRGGLGSLAGVPGTIGGAIRMNAGTYLGEIGDVVDWVEWFNPADNTVHRNTASELHFTYRKIGLPWGAMVLRVRLVTHENDVPAEQESIKAHLARRKATQPLHLPSCGSVFKNPTGDYAGRLIEQVGLKGTQIGQAQISEKHANFIVNLGGASAMDVAKLIQLARQRVFDETGIELEPEVRREGRWDENVWAIERT
jgi:UDP-N-acetylmuramate dehydrogenase